MAIPGFQDVMLPLLKYAADGHEHAMGEAVQALAAEFHLTPDELADPLPSGRQLRFANRVYWSGTYLRKTKLLEAAGRGRIRITQRGLETLSKKPKRVDLAYLAQFPELEEFRSAGSGKAAKVTSVQLPDDQTPEEAMEQIHQSITESLRDDLLARIKAAPPAFFEQFVVDLLVAMGYGGSRSDAGEAVGQSGDGGIDGIIKEDALGLDAVYVQAKRWEGTVGRPIVQAFAGSLEGARARKGVLLTTSNFSADAKEYVRHIEKRIVLIDGDQLTRLLVQHGVGVTERARYSIYRLDEEYFGQ